LAKPSETPPADPATPCRPRRVLRWLVGVALVITAACLAGYAYLQTESGRQFVVRTVGELTRFYSGGGITVGAIGPGLPGRIAMENLEVSDRSGRWLSAKRFVLTWQPLALLAGRLHVEAIDVEGLDLERLPEPTSEETPDEPMVSLPVAIAVDSIHVADVHVGPTVVGRDVGARIIGRLAVDRSTATRAVIHIARTDDVPGSASLGASYDPSDSFLAVTAEIEEGAGGVIATLAGLEPGTTVGLRVEGEGPLADWRGTVSADVRDLASLEAELTLRRDQAWHPRITGRLDVARTLSEAIEPLTRQSVAFDVGADIDDAAVVGRAAVSATGIVVRADGRYDRLQRRIEAELTGTVDDAGGARGWLTPSSVEAGEVRLSIRGPVERPNADLDVKVRGLRHDGIDIAAVVVEASAAPPPASGGSAHLDVVASAQATGIRTDDADLGRAFGDTVTLDVRGTVDPDAETFRITTANVIAAAVRAGASGHGDFEGADLDVVIDLVVDDLSRLRLGDGAGIEGSVAATLTAGRSAADPEIAGRLTVDLRQASAGDPVVDALVRSGVTIAADYRLAGAERLTVDVLTVRSEHVQGLGRASLHHALSRLEASLHVDVPALAPLSAAADMPLKGALALDAIADGEAADPEVSVTLTLRDGNVAGTGVPRAVATLAASRPLSRPVGTLSVEADTDLTPLTLSLDLELAGGQRLIIDNVAGKAAGMALSGALDVPLDGGPVVGEVVARLSEATTGDRGLRVSGRGEAAVGLDVAAAVQRMTVRGRVNELRVASPDQPVVRAGTLELQARLNDPFGRFSGDARLSARQLAVDDLTLVEVEASASGSLRALNVGVRGATASGDTLMLGGTLEAAASGDMSLVLTDLSGRLQAQDIRLEAPARIRFGDDSFSVDDLALRFGPGRLAVQVARRPGTVDGQLDWSSLPIAAVWSETPVSGVAQGSLRISTEGGKLAGRMQARADTSPGDRKTISTVPPLSAIADVAWRGGVVDGDLRLSGVGTEDLVVRARVPMSVNADTLDVNVSERTPIDASIRWQGDVAALSEALPLSEHRLRGPGRIALDIGGSIAAPRVAGDISLSNARYEHLVLGTLIRALTLRGSSSPEGAFLVTLSGQDGASGTVTAEAKAAIGNGTPTRIEAAAELNTMTVVLRDDMTAVASGRVDYGPVDRASRIRGRLRVDRADVKLLDRLPPSIVVLEVTEIRGGRSLAPPPAPQEPERPTALDIVVDIPGRAFVRGRGLESEWGGTLTVSGTIDEPSLVGEFRLVRGEFALAGKTFELTNGIISFDGGSEMDPRLNIEAECTANNITAVISVRGRASRPEIELASRPGLPESEILPRVLFGKRADQMGPGEAVQLALALDTLVRGESVTGGLLGQARDLIGLDVLTFESDADGGGGTSVRAGRNIGDRIYVETRQGSRTGTSRYRGEIKLTPQISVESEVGEGGESDEPSNYFGLKWEYRY
jgi:translocation and assembly module TamB